MVLHNTFIYYHHAWLIWSIMAHHASIIIAVGYYPVFQPQGWNYHWRLTSSQCEESPVEFPETPIALDQSISDINIPFRAVFSWNVEKMINSCHARQNNLPCQRFLLHSWQCWGAATLVESRVNRRQHGYTFTFQSKLHESTWRDNKPYVQNMMGSQVHVHINTRKREMTYIVCAFLQVAQYSSVAS